MSTFLSNKNGRVRSVGHKCTTTSRETIYTCPKNHTTLITLLFLSNTDTANRDVTIEWYHADEATYYTVFASSISSKNFLQFSDGYMVLNEDDRFHITAGAADVINAVISVEEIFDPVTH